MLESANSGVRVDELIADVQGALDAGPPSQGRAEFSLELAKLLEGQGDYAAARLADLAGDTDRAAPHVPAKAYRGRSPDNPIVNP